MNVQHRIEILEKLGNYILSDNSEWKSIKERAVQENTWFIPEFIDLAVQHIGNIFCNQTRCIISLNSIRFLL